MRSFVFPAIFGPTDEALNAAGITSARQLSEDTLLQHGFIGEEYAANFAANTCQEFSALDQTTLVVQTASDGTITVNGGACAYTRES